MKRTSSDHRHWANQSDGWTPRKLIIEFLISVERVNIDGKITFWLFDRRGSALNIGVFICGCNDSISSNIDMERVAEEAGVLEDVSFVDSHAQLCSLAGQGSFKNSIKGKKLDRAVIVACSPKMGEDRFRQWASEAGMNPYCVEIVNAREHIAWVHDDLEGATEATIALMRGAIAKARLIEPLEPHKVKVEQSCLVIGGGVAGIQAALDVA
ncbi:MAG: hypothetical protein ACE5QW_05540, partial [Thermoplasmata archaeon]